MTHADWTDRDYIAACGKAETEAKRGRRLLQGAVYVSLVAIIVGLVGLLNQSTIAGLWRWWSTDRPFLAANIWPYVLNPQAEQTLEPGQSFRECAPRKEGKDYCPEMIVVPAGSFMMGSPQTQKGHSPDEGPQHPVTISKAFAVAKYQLTFDEWDTCVVYGGCPQGISDSGWGRGRRPVIYVSWDDAQRYVAWLSRMTGKPYRLLTEAEYEYAARGGTQTAYPWGDDIKFDGKAMANCDGCGSRWDGKQTAPVGSFPPNQFGLFDMVGNVWEWVEDCLHLNYNGAPLDGSAWIIGGSCYPRIVRGGSWDVSPVDLRSADRFRVGTDDRSLVLGFRVARTLAAAGAITVAPGVP